MDLENLKAEHPDLYAQVLEEGKAQGRAEGERDGAKAERQRIQAIDDLGIAGHESLLAKAKFEEPMSAEAVAVEIIKAEKAKGGKFLANRQADADALKDVGAGAEDIEPAADDDQKAESFRNTAVSAFKGAAGQFGKKE